MSNQRPLKILITTEEKYSYLEPYHSEEERRGIKLNLVTNVIHVHVQPLEVFNLLYILCNMERTLRPYFVVANV